MILVDVLSDVILVVICFVVVKKAPVLLSEDVVTPVV